MPVLASSPRSSRWPRLLGLASLLAAVGCAAYLLFGVGYTTQTAAGNPGTDGGVVTVTATQGWQDYAIVGWSSLVVVLGVLAAVAARRGRSGPVWVAAVILVMTAALGLASIGLFVAPVALLVAFTAYGLSASRRRGRAADSAPANSGSFYSCSSSRLSLSRWCGGASVAAEPGGCKASAADSPILRGGCSP